MANEDQLNSSSTDPTMPVVDGTTSKEASKELGKSGVFSKLNKELTDAELTSPGVGKMLLEERNRLQQEKISLEIYKEDYHKADKRADVCEARNEGVTKGQMLYTISQTVGGVIFGAAFSLEQNKTLFWMLIVLGSVLAIGSILINFLNKDKRI